jgi:8-oxo-dGTP pyrophosphatase MutT (NUDIX family)
MEHEEHFLGKVAQKAIIHHNGKVFLTRDPRTPDTWELPGGRLNVGEKPKEGLIRELLEELGLECEIDDAIYLEQFRQGNESGQLSLVIVYKATMKPESKIKVDPREVVEYGWFSQEDIAKMRLFPEYDEAIKVFFTS